MIAQVVDPMISVLTGLLESSPSAVAMLILVIKFLKFIKDRDDNYDLRDAERIAQYKVLVDNMANVVRDNTIALRENASALAKIKQ